MGRFASVISRARFPLSQLSTSITNLLEVIPSHMTNMNVTSLSLRNCCCCFGIIGGQRRRRTRRDPNEIIITELVPNVITPEEEIEPQELEIRFAELVEELDLTTANKTAMLSLPLEKKWQIYCSRRNEPEVVSYSPEYYIDRVGAFMPQESPKLFESLKTSLRTQPNSFVTHYLELNGLDLLLNCLKNENISSTHSPIIGCLKSILNNSTGRAFFLAHPQALNIISESLGGTNSKCKVDVLEILGAVCLVPGGHRKVLDAVSYFQDFAGERVRFQTIITDLDRSTGPYKQDVTIKTAIMSFLNAILSYGPGQECTEFRLHLRYEMLMLGIVPILDKLRHFENQTLDKHLDFFEMMRGEDEKEFGRRVGQAHVDSTDTDAMFAIIKTRLSHSISYTNLQSILVHLLLMPEIGDSHWLLLDRVLQQIVLDPNQDRVVLSINVQDVVKKLGEETQMNVMECKLDSLNIENSELMKKLIAKEQELELSTQEKEILEITIHNLQDKYNCSSQVSSSGNNSSPDSFSRRGSTSSNNEFKIPLVVPPFNISNIGSKISSLSCNHPATPQQPPPPPPILQQQHLNNNNFIHKSNGGGVISTNNVNILPPPPPPPPMPQFEMSSSMSLKIKTTKAPLPSTQLKSFNWSKLPESKICGTLWNDLNEEFETLDLNEIDRLFSAYQKNGLTGGESNQNTSQPHEKIKRVLSLIDGRRAQNCTILLSKLKMSDEDICNAIVSMDSRDNLPLDMVEQLLKFTPSLEERSLLEEHQDEEMARADTFLLKISRITHYEERLQTLHFKKRFKTITQDLNIKMSSVISACNELKSSSKLLKILQLVLSLGNYMNKGGRGNASGFRLSSLSRLQDTKSSSMKMTLLNYLVNTIEERAKELLTIEDEIGSVRNASKVSLQELEKEITALRIGLGQIQGEVEFQRSQPLSPGDRFLPSTREFLTIAGPKIEVLEALYSDMKWKFTQTVQHFGEDTTQIDEFFSIFDNFLTSFLEARVENENVKKRREEAEGKKQTTLRRTKQSTVINSNPEEKKSDNKGEFDDLISALRTGDVFTDLDSRKRSRSRKANRERIH